MHHFYVQEIKAFLESSDLEQCEKGQSNKFPQNQITMVLFKRFQTFIAAKRPWNLHWTKFWKMFPNIKALPCPRNTLDAHLISSAIKIYCSANFNKSNSSIISCLYENKSTPYQCRYYLQVWKVKSVLLL